MKKILNIVVTGGPCGGKTTILDELTALLRSYGYTVYIVNEAATELINSGIKPYGDFKIALRDFQSLLLDTQLGNEYIRKIAAEVCPNPKIEAMIDSGPLSGINVFAPRLLFGNAPAYITIIKNAPVRPPPAITGIIHSFTMEGYG